MTDIVISSGHGLHIRGASCKETGMDEVNEARKVVEQVADYLLKLGCGVVTFHDDVSTTQSENLETIVDFHNDQERDWDVSVHFNAAFDPPTQKPVGCEVFYASNTGASMASKLSNGIAKFGEFINRGAKDGSGLYFLGNTEMPAVLLEISFVDSFADTELYRKNFDLICRAIAVGLSGLHFKRNQGVAGVPENQREITASVFGGESDYNVSAYDEDVVLNDTDFYIALPDRFEGDRPDVKVHNLATGKSAVASIEDVGPWNIDDPYWDKGTRPQAETGTDMSGRTTNKAGIDLSPALAKAIGIDGMGMVDWEFI